MVRGDGDAADDAQILQGGQAIDHLASVRFRSLAICACGRLDQRQAGLVAAIRRRSVWSRSSPCPHPKADEELLKLGELPDGQPGLGLDPGGGFGDAFGRGVARTNHMFSSWSRA